MYYFALTAAFAERETAMATLKDYFNCISPEDFVAAAFTECGKKKVKPSKRPVGRPKKRPLEVREAQADKESVQVALIPADSEEPTSVKSVLSQYTAKQKQRIVQYARHHGVRGGNE